MNETHEIINGNYQSVEEVKVKFTTIVEVPTEQVYSEEDCLRTIASLENDKLTYCAAKDAEIEINNLMLAKIRAIDRALNITEQ